MHTFKSTVCLSLAYYECGSHVVLQHAFNVEQEKPIMCRHFSHTLVESRVLGAPTDHTKLLLLCKPHVGNISLFRSIKVVILGKQGVLGNDFYFL